MGDARGMNPYGVGRSAAQQGQRTTRCACCELPFSVTARVGALLPRWCRDCAHHRPTKSVESRERRLARYEEHQSRWVEHLDAALEAAGEATRRQVNAEQATAAAMQDRSHWRALVREIGRLHREVEQGRCACGNDKFPCTTAQTLQEAGASVSEWLAQQPRQPPAP